SVEECMCKIFFCKLFIFLPTNPNNQSSTSMHNNLHITFLVFLFACTFIFSLKPQNISLNEVSVLIPWGSQGTILEAKGSSCFTWSTTDPELLQIIPAPKRNEKLNTSCANRIRVCCNN